MYDIAGISCISTKRVFKK